MKTVVFQLVLLSAIAVVFGDYWEDIVAEFNGDVNDESVPPNESNRDTRNDYDRNSWNNSPNTVSAVTRIMDQLMRQCNGDVAVILSTLERRFNVRVSPNADYVTRLNAIVSAANACLASYGYGYYRPLVNAVAERLGAMIVALGSTGGSGPGSGSRPTAYRPPQSSSSFQGSSSWGFRPGTYNQAQGTMNAQSNVQRPADPSYNVISDYWALKPQPFDEDWRGPTPIIHSSSSSALFLPNLGDDDWPPSSRRSAGELFVPSDSPVTQQPVTQDPLTLRPVTQRPAPQRPFNQGFRNTNRRRNIE